MATSKQINNTIQAVKTRVSRLMRELSEAREKIANLTANYKKVVEAEKKANAKKVGKKPAKKVVAKKAVAKKKVTAKASKRR